MNKSPLSSPNQEPDLNMIGNILQSAYNAYTAFLLCIEKNHGQYTSEWKYYKDGKSWLCKIQAKKKTICWLSIWDNYFRLSFYFTERSIEDISNLDIDKSLKEQFAISETVGRLRPLIIDIQKETQLPDIYVLMEYKRSLV